MPSREERADMTHDELLRAVWVLDKWIEDAEQRQEGAEKYINWLENMVILLSKSYQKTHDMLLKKAKNKETDAYFQMPTVQGFALAMMVDKISQKTANEGKFSEEELEGWANWLIEKHPKKTGRVEL